MLAAIPDVRALPRQDEHRDEEDRRDQEGAHANALDGRRGLDTDELEKEPRAKADVASDEEDLYGQPPPSKRAMIVEHPVHVPTPFRDQSLQVGEFLVEQNVSSEPMDSLRAQR